MATFKICVFSHQERRDGKYPVSIRVTWKRKHAFISTGIYVSLEQIDHRKTRLASGRIHRRFQVKDSFVIASLNERIKIYEQLKVNKLGYEIESYSAAQLAKYFSREGAPGSDGVIDFVAFARQHCERLRSKGKEKTASALLSPLNSLIDYCNGREKVSITEITALFLQGFESYLRAPRKVTRKGNKTTVTIKRSAMGDGGVHDYMTSIRTLFNAVMNEYNDEDRGDIRIKHYPFRKYKIVRRGNIEKRVLTIPQLKKVIAYKGTGREKLGRDVFFLSFCLAGTNLADLYHAPYSALKGGRFSYNRQKTKGRRTDEAFISMIISREARSLVKQYADPLKRAAFRFGGDYVTETGFITAVNIGLKQVAEACEIPALTSYYARFTFATIARNDCGVSMDDISMALNHVDRDRRVTDGYIKKDWGIVDRTIRAVLDKIS